MNAIIMAGGASDRMRATSGPRHKALTEIAGRTLAEWNVRMLVAGGFDAIVFVVRASEYDVAAYADDVLRRVAATAGAEFRIQLESAPLGNAGGAAAVSLDGDVLAVFVDNLTTLDARAMFEQHRRSGAALTIATHEETFRNPFGEVNVRDGRVVAYCEKPSSRVRICSGTFVLGERARAAVTPGECIDLATLCTRLLAAGAHVGAFEHAALWIDVNDAAAIARAEALVAANRASFPSA